MYAILVYDIRSGEGAGRVTRNVFKTCKGFLTHVQNSVFEGNLERPQLLDLKNKLKKYLRKEEDSCIIFVNNNENWLRKEILTDEEDKTSNIL